MRILEISDSGTVGTIAAGPVSSVVSHIANALADQGHSVCVADHPAEVPREQLRPDVRVHELPADERRWGRLPAIAGQLVTARGLFNALQPCLDSFRPDLVHVHDAALALVFGRRHPGLVLWTSHGMNWTMEGPDTERTRGPRSRVGRFLEVAACRAATRTVVLNSQTLAALCSTQVSHIPNGIDLDAWPAPDKQAARMALGMASDRFCVTFVGRISPSKGVHVFADAVELAAREVDLQSQAVGSLGGMFGNTTDVTAYARQVMGRSRRTRFLGFIPRSDPEYAQRLSASDVVVVSSLTEPFGLVVLEALACGARVIGSNVGGIRDLLGNGLGSVVPPGDAGALAAAIVAAARQRRTIAPLEQRLALRRYDWKVVGLEYSRLMQRMHEAAKHEVSHAAI